MPWVRIDDGYADHPKMAAVGPLGQALWLAGLAYCNRYLTDGFIPRTQPKLSCPSNPAGELLKQRPQAIDRKVLLEHPAAKMEQLEPKMITASQAVSTNVPSRFEV